jgi:hypothetical protein
MKVTYQPTLMSANLKTPQFILAQNQTLTLMEASSSLDSFRNQILLVMVTKSWLMDDTNYQDFVMVIAIWNLVMLTKFRMCQKKRKFIKSVLSS